MTSRGLDSRIINLNDHKSKCIRQLVPNYAKTIPTSYNPLFILPNGLIIQNNGVLHPVISQMKDVTSNATDSFRIPKCKVRKVIKRSLSSIYKKLPFILPKDIVRNNKEVQTDVGDESHNTNGAVKMQDILVDKPSIMLNDKINEYNNIEIIGTHEVSDKVSIVSDVIKTESIVGICNSPQNASLGDCDTTKISSSRLLNGHINEENSNFVENEIVNKHIETATSVFETTKLVQPHHTTSKQGIKDNFEIAQTCEFVPDENSIKCHIFIKNKDKCSNDKQDINISKHTLLGKQVCKSVTYIPDPNDKECGIVIKSEITEESNESLEDACNTDLEETLSINSKSVTNDYSHTLQRRNLRLEKLPIINETNQIWHDSSVMQKLKNNNEIADNIVISDLTAYTEKISIKSEIIGDSETLMQKNSDVIFDKPLLKTTKNVIKNKLQQLNVTSNTRSQTSIRTSKSLLGKVIKRNLDFNSNKPPVILSKDINDKKKFSNISNKSHIINDMVKMQDILIDKHSVRLNDKTNECNNAEIVTETNEVSDKAMNTHLNGVDNKCDKTSITSDVIKTEIIEEICDLSTNTNLKDCDTTKISSSRLLNRHDNAQNSNFVENEIENRDFENAKSVFEITKLVQPSHIKQEIEDYFEIPQTCEFDHILKTDKCNMFIKNTNKCSIDKQYINNSKHALFCKQVNESLDYMRDPNDKECSIVIKSEIIEESNDSSEDACEIDFAQKKTLLTDSRPTTNNYNYSLRKRNLKLDNPPSVNKKKKILSGSSLMEKSKSNNEFCNTTIIADVTAYAEKTSIKSEIIDISEIFLHKTSNVICGKSMLKTTKNVIKSNSLEKAHLKESIRTVNQKRKKRKCQRKRKVRKNI